MRFYPVIDILSSWVIGDETLGSKPKVWFRFEGHEWLFKEARGNTGEDWAEKVAAEIACGANIPAAKVELAVYRGRRGCASRSFVARSSGMNLVHGNEILAGEVIGYDRNKRFQQSDHTLRNVATAIRSLFHESVARARALQRLASYMVLDAFIGNTDRHHENWGILETRQLHAACDVGAMNEVAPTFDHASSLGRELTDERRSRLLANGKIGEYLRNGRGGVYWSSGDLQGENPQRLLARAMNEHDCREHFLPALMGITSMTDAQLSAFLESVPEDRMSAVAKTFCAAFLAESLKMLKELV